MKDKHPGKTKAQMEAELARLRRRISELEQAEAERERAQDALELGRRQMLSIFEGIDQVIFVVDPNSYEVLYANRAVRDIFGAVQGRKCFEAFYKLDAPCSFCTSDMMFGQNLGKTHVWLRHNPINKKWYRCIGRAIRWPDGRWVRYQLSIDITEHKRTEEQLTASLKEKDILLLEIHHRVKNNLQVISSLLNLQSEFVGDQQARELFHASRNRVKLMALIHEKLYQSENLAKIDFAGYLRSLASSLFRSFGVNPEAITLSISAEGTVLPLDVAIPCALIINELVSNCLKHAFPGGGEGKIRIDLRSDHDSEYTLVVADNGVGFPEEVDFRNTESLGLQLVNTLTDQLGGTIELDRSNGTEFRIAFQD